MSLKAYAAALALLLLALPCRPQEVTLQTAAFTWTLTADGRTTSLLQAGTGRELCAAPGQPAFELVTQDGAFAPERLTLDGQTLTVRFAGGAGECDFALTTGPRHLILKLQRLTTAAPLVRLTLCRLHVPREGTLATLLNAWRTPETSVALMALSPNTCPGLSTGVGGLASPGSSARCEQVPDARAGRYAARLSAHNPTDQVAWTCWNRALDRPLDLTGHAGIGAWIHGDGQGELLKIQLHDGSNAPNHWRDYYFPIDFTGWRWCELPVPPDEPLDYSHITQCNLYFNGVPPQADVECLVDDIRALRRLTGAPSTDPADWVLADFEDSSAPYFDQPGTRLSAGCFAEFGTADAGVALIACPDAQLPAAIEDLQIAAGLPCPRFSTYWAKTSPDVKSSYLFIFDMNRDSVQAAIDFAKACHFSAILLGESVWAQTCGHFAVNTTHWPGGVPDLRAAVDRIHAAGLRCGLHFLSAGVGENDAYVTPVPDDRLVMDCFAELAADVDAGADLLSTTLAPSAFPAVEGGYLGDSAILRLGDELIRYDRTSLDTPFGFTGCRRGYLGTTPAPHRRGERIAHMKRAYGLFLHDMDKGLTAEVAANVARVANAVGADMLYLDGAEALQGPHWYYQAKLVKTYWDALGGREDVLMQASSLSHYSWHMLSRCASADGHGDLKGYLDERIPGFRWLADNLMPLDLGWYYIHTLETRPDQFEYICQKALGFGCSVSVQTTPHMIATHPRMDEFIRLFGSYEDLRHSGHLSPEMLASLRIPRQEYLLSSEGAGPIFRRVVYSEPIPLTPEATPASLSVTTDPALGTPHLCLDIRAGDQVAPGPEYNASDAWLLDDFEDLTPYHAPAAGALNIGTNLAGSTSPGVTQSLESVTEGARLGERCARYTAVSTRSDNAGWSAVGRRLDPPLDLREHVALGVWVCGDSSGASLKIQPRDAAGHAQDYYIPIDFTGWRYFVLPRPAEPWPEPIVYDQVSTVTLYYNGLPAGRTCTVLVDGLKALRRVTEVRTPAPELTLGGRSLRFDATLGPGDWLLYRGGPSATLKSVGRAPAQVAVTGNLDAALSAANNLTVNPAAAGPQTRELTVSPFIAYD